jgi:integrase
MRKSKHRGLRKRGGVWWIRYYRNGRRYEESAKTDKWEKARDLLRTREGDIAKGVPVTPNIGRLKFEEAVGDVVTDYKTNGKRSLDDLQRRIDNHLIPYFGGRRMVTIGTADLRAYVAERQAPTKHDDGTEEAGAAAATINRELAVIKRAFRLAVQAGKLLAIPHIPMLRENNIRQGFFERTEFEDVRAKLPAALRGLVTFAYFTGWRIRSEVLGLTWSQVDRKAHTIRLEPGQTKSREGRTLPYDALTELREVIDEQWREHERLKAENRIVPFVFHREALVKQPDGSLKLQPGQPIKSFRKAWDSACGDAGVRRIPHDFRRTAVRNLVRAGVPERTAMQITGHKTRSVFDRYDIVNEAVLRYAVG